MRARHTSTSNIFSASHLHRAVLVRPAVLLAAMALLASCSSPLGNDAPDPTATLAPTVVPTATASPTPAPTNTPAPTATPTVFVPPTVAVAEDDSPQQCLERNLTPELLISLSMDDTSLTQDIFRTCLVTIVPEELVFLLDPVIEDASECALDVSKTLSNDELIALASGDSAKQDAITESVSTDILSCMSEKYGFDFG